MARKNYPQKLPQKDSQKWPQKWLQKWLNKLLPNVNPKNDTERWPKKLPYIRSSKKGTKNGFQNGPRNWLKKCSPIKANEIAPQKNIIKGPMVLTWYWGSGGKNPNWESWIGYCCLEACHWILSFVWKIWLQSCGWHQSFLHFTFRKMYLVKLPVEKFDILCFV